jgi:predicted dienelactone hydrolase
MPASVRPAPAAAARARVAALLVAALCALAASCEPGTVAIESPAEGAVLPGPEAEVTVRFAPRLAPAETLRATLLRGLDAVDETPSAEDVSGDLVVAGDGRTANLSVRDLPPGRSALAVERLLPGRSGRVRGMAARILDRGGFAHPGPGPFGVGVRQAELTRPATTQPGGTRHLPLLVWYPTDDPAAPVDGALGGAPDAPLAAGAGELPALLFSHGSCGAPDQSTFLARALAAAGYVLVAMAHTGNTALDPDCDALANLVVSFVERPRDVRATLDWLLARNADPGSFWFGAVDPERVGVTGHSFGGQTTVRAAGSDPRYRAALPLAPEYQFTAGLLAPLLPLPVPTMVQGGTADTTTPYGPNQVALYQALAPPRFLVGIEGAGHGAFSDCPACGGALPRDEAHALVLRYALGFLGRYVARDRRWASLLEPAPGVLFTQER